MQTLNTLQINHTEQPANDSTQLELYYTIYTHSSYIATAITQIERGLVWVWTQLPC